MRLWDFRASGVRLRIAGSQCLESTYILHFEGAVLLGHWLSFPSVAMCAIRLRRRMCWITSRSSLKCRCQGGPVVEELR